MEFLCFREILWNLVLAGDKGTNAAYFGRVQAAIENKLLYIVLYIVHYCNVKYMPGTRALTGAILKILSYLKYSQFIWETDCMSAVAVIDDKYILHIWSGSGDRRNCYMWKICRSALQNLANWPAEFRKI